MSWRILIVDDDDIMREGLMKNIPWASHDIEVFEACNGQDGLEMAEKLRPQVILSDICMPFMDGLDMAARVREFLPETQLVFLTGFEDFSYARRAITLRATEYVLKAEDNPVIFQSVLRALEAWKEARRMMPPDRVRAAAEKGSLSGTEAAHRDILEKVLAAIETHFPDSELSLQTLADTVHLTPAYISTLFKRYQGKGFSDWLTEYRVKTAVRLMEETQLKNFEVAEHVGIPNPQYFSVIFKKVMGQSPTEFRESIKKKRA